MPGHFKATASICSVGSIISPSEVQNKNSSFPCESQYMSGIFCYKDTSVSSFSLLACEYISHRQLTFQQWWINKLHAKV